MKTLLISHFYNEEWLLPHWIQHHRGMFDRAVMINYGSTDRSLDIISHLAPAWEIRNSRNRLFSAPEVDAEVMDIEREFSGYWKVALNTTEFLVMPKLDLKATLEKMLGIYPSAFAVAAHGMKMIDRAEDMHATVNECKPLLFQRHWGINETPGYGPGRSRHRTIHCMEHGHYELGRHYIKVGPVATMSDELYCCWFGWSPYAHLRDRKMQIQHRMPAHHIAMGLGVEHNLPSVESADMWFRHWSNASYDLWQDEAFKQTVESCRAYYPRPYICGDTARNFTL